LTAVLVSPNETSRPVSFARSARAAPHRTTLQSSSQHHARSACDVRKACRYFEPFESFETNKLACALLAAAAIGYFDTNSVSCFDPIGPCCRSMLQRETCPKFQAEIWSWCNGTFTPRANMLLMGSGRQWKPTWCTRIKRQVGLHIDATPCQMCRPLKCYILLHETAHNAHCTDSTAVPGQPGIILGFSLT